MMDIGTTAGYPLRFDPDSFAIEAGPGFRFAARHRTAQAMAAVLEEPNAVDAETEVYRTYLPEEFPEPAASALAENLLTYSLVAVRPIRVGREAAKTHGHIHPVLPGTSLTTPEIYAQLYGRLVVMLQRHDPRDIERITEFVAVELTAGETILIPPGWAHGLANPFEDAGLLAGLYADPGRFPADYGPMQAHRGMAWRVRPEVGAYDLDPNPAYAPMPARRLDHPAGTAFEPDSGWAPLWSAAVADPSSFRFLAFSDEAMSRFADPAGASP